MNWGNSFSNPKCRRSFESSIRRLDRRSIRPIRTSTTSTVTLPIDPRFRISAKWTGRFWTNGGPQTVRLDLFYGVCKGVCNRKLPLPHGTTCNGCASVYHDLATEVQLNRNRKTSRLSGSGSSDCCGAGRAHFPPFPLDLD